MTRAQLKRIEYDKGYWRCMLNPFEECREVCTMEYVRASDDY